jgi:hypothetical protein
LQISTIDRRFGVPAWCPDPTTAAREPFSPGSATTVMARIVQKYGGTSVGDVDRIKNVAMRIKEAQVAGNELVVVVSARAGVTN